MVFPRVLVINGEPFNQHSATGLTMTSLFSGWPKENLACLYTAEVEPDEKVCKYYWKLSVGNIRMVRHMFGMMRYLSPRGWLKPESHVKSAPNLRNGTVLGAPPAYRFLQKIFPNQRVIDLGHFEVPQHIANGIDGFNPQIIYTMLGSNPILRLTIDMCLRYGIHAVPHFMDDWPKALYRFSLFRPILRYRMNSYLRRVLANVPVRLVIGKDMASEYSRRYGGEFLPFANAIEPELLNCPVSDPPKRRRIRLVYVGGLHLNRWSSLRDIGMALLYLHEKGMPLEALIYTQPGHAKEALSLEIPPVMRVLGSLSPTEVPAVLRDADILIHVESFVRSSQIHARYSVSTKIPEYMAAGRPILAYGPKELASIDYVHDTGAGVVAGTADKEELITALQQLILSEDLRRRCGMNGRAIAMQNHDAAKQRDGFRSILFASAAFSVKRPNELTSRLGKYPFQVSVDPRD